MNNISLDVPQYLYSEHLKVIKDIRFTKREMDVIASTVCGRSSTVSVFLSISPKTVSAHISNILQKIKGTSREDIINFMEHSDQYVFIHQYYISLVIYRFFEKYLVKIKHLIKEKISNCGVFYDEEVSKQKSTLLEELEKHLSCIGITSEFKEKDIHNLVFEAKSYHDKPVIYLSFDSKNSTVELQKAEISFLNLSESKVYYFYFFEILKNYIRILALMKLKEILRSITLRFVVLLDKFIQELDISRGKR